MSLSPEATLAECSEKFPGFADFWKGNDDFLNEDGTFEPCGVLIALTWFIREQGERFAEEQWRCLAEMASRYFDLNEETRGMLGACLIEMLESEEHAEAVVKHFDDRLLRHFSYPYLTRPTRTPRELSPELDAHEVELLVLLPGGDCETVVATDPTTEEIADHVLALPWKPITFVIAKFDEANWLEGSGSIDPDVGLSMRCQVGGTEYVVRPAPGSVSVVCDALQSFAAKDGRWRTMVEWS